jgi:hypothetical protein
LFQQKLFDLYSEVTAVGLFPLLTELNEVDRAHQVSSWHWLAKSNKRLPIFLNLLNKDILPHAQAFSVDCLGKELEKEPSGGSIATRLISLRTLEEGYSIKLRYFYRERM